MQTVDPTNTYTYAAEAPSLYQLQEGSWHNSWLRKGRKTRKKGRLTAFWNLRDKIDIDFVCCPTLIFSLARPFLFTGYNGSFPASFAGTDCFTRQAKTRPSRDLLTTLKMAICGVSGSGKGGSGIQVQTRGKRQSSLDFSSNTTRLAITPS